MATQSFRGAGGGGAVVASYRSDGLRGEHDYSPLVQNVESEGGSVEDTVADASIALSVLVAVLVGAWVFVT